MCELPLSCVRGERSATLEAMRSINLAGMLAVWLGVVGGVVRAEALEETVARYEALGMPNVAGAQYVRLKYDYSFSVSGRFSFSDVGFCGNGWLMPLADGSTNLVIYSIMGERIAVPANVKGIWEPARLARDIFYVTEAAGTMTHSGDDVGSLNPPNLFMLQSYSENPLGIFFFALQLFRHGEKDQARTIIDIFGKKGLLDKLDRMATERLAETRLLIAFQGFARNRDFVAYAVAVEDVQRSFSNIVSDAFGEKINQSLCLARQRVAGKIADVPGLSEEDQKIAGQLVSLREPLVPLCYTVYGLRGPKLQRSYPWLLPEACLGLFPDTEGPVWDLLRKGPEMIPVLVAMEEDRVLVDGFFKTFWDDGRDGPSSRRDVASAMLSAVLFDGDDWGSLLYVGDMFSAAAETYVKELSPWTPDDIAMMYLKVVFKGKNIDGQSALHAWLVRRAAKGAFKDLETWLLSYPLDEKLNGGVFDWIDGDYVCFQLPRDYATARGADAQEFVEAVAKRLEALSKSFTFSDISMGNSKDWTPEEMEEIETRKKRRVDATREQFAEWAIALRKLDLGPSDSASAQARAEAIAVPLEQALREEIRAYLEEQK